MLGLMQGLDFFGGQVLKDEEMLQAEELEMERENDRIVVFSDLWLDRPNTLDKLNAVLSGGHQS